MHPYRNKQNINQIILYVNSSDNHGLIKNSQNIKMNISFYFICNVIDNIQPRADWDGEFKWGKEDASHLIVSSIDTIRGLDEDMWSDLRAVLLERYKGK